MGGLVLITAALVSGGLAWRAHQRWEREAPASAPPIATAQALRAELPAPHPLPPTSDVPLLLARMQRAAVQQGLGWPAADYRLNPATEETPASLDVRCALTGPYPSIRRFVTVLLRDNATLTLREFSLSRASAETADVEAKLGIVVYLASGTAGPVATGAATP
ncbi:hypothetical protein [Ideonella sp. YS5]|uniref:hypothetical protein n=1 Tax=Ideonella sp. YS5 TaxID=3453714 RepID=UPI003EEFF916